MGEGWGGRGGGGGRGRKKEGKGGRGKENRTFARGEEQTHPASLKLSSFITLLGALVDQTRNGM
jgi:hypothetical protein